MSTPTLARRSTSLLVVAVLLGFGTLFAASPASALGTCPPGSSLSSNLGVCVDLGGKVTGGSRASIPVAKPVELPSSVLSAAEGPGLTTSEAANAAGSIGTAGEAGGALELGSAVPVVGQVIMAGALGYGLGSEGVHIACSFGVKALCAPSMPPSFVPNGDAGQVSDGWSGPYAPGSWSADCPDNPGLCLVTNYGVNIDGAAYAYGGATPSLDPTGLSIHYTAARTDGQRQNVQIGVRFWEVCEDGTGGDSIFNVAQIDDPGSFTVTGSGSGGITPAASYNCASHGGLDRLYLMGIGGSGGLVGNPSNDQLVPGWSAASPGLSDNAAVTTYVKAHSVEQWLPQGNPDRHDASADPVRYWKVTGECGAVGSDSSTWDEISAVGTDAFHETDATRPGPPDLGNCPSGETLQRLDLWESSSGLADKHFWGSIVPQAVQQLQHDHPECLDGSCSLGLWKVTPQGHENCFSSNDECADWFTDPTNADDYVCTYGPGALSTFAAGQATDLSECTIYAPAFDPQQLAKGTPYGDPTTGTAVDTSTDTNTDPAPGGAGSGSPSCFPSGWSAFNPVQWVLQPIKCAFIPDPSKLSDLETSARTDLSDSGFGPWVTALGGLFGKLGGSGGGCTGPTVTFPLTSTSMQPFNACSEPMATVASVSYAFSTVLLVVFGAYAGMKAVGSAFGFHVALGERARTD